MSLIERVKPILEKHFIFDGEVSLDTKFIEDLGADSFDIIEFINDIEDEFAISVSSNEIVNIQTIGDMTNCITEKIKKSAR